MRERAGFARGCKVRYVWSKEIGKAEKPRYHLLILLNRDADYTLGRLFPERVNMMSRMEGTWAGAFGIAIERVGGLVRVPEYAEYRIHRYVRRGDVDELPELFYRSSYLCKVAIKFYGDRQRGFDTSREVKSLYELYVVA